MIATDQMKEIYEQVAMPSSEGRRALATIIMTKGSTPRKVGAKMLVLPDGRFLGTIGGGCGEQDVFHEAVRVIEDGLPRIVDVDLTADEAGESGDVCGVCRACLAFGTGAGATTGHAVGNGLVVMVVCVVVPLLTVRGLRGHIAHGWHGDAAPPLRSSPARDDPLVVREGQGRQGLRGKPPHLAHLGAGDRLTVRLAGRVHHQHDRVARLGVHAEQLGDLDAQARFLDHLASGRLFQPLAAVGVAGRERPESQTGLDRPPV
jgi:hypothetical protein